MDKWVSKLKKNKIALVIYARFPSEMGYGNHIIQVANGFLKNNFDVCIYYPKTYNSKTITQNPETYYEVTNNINFKEIKNFDVTSFSIYELLPSVLKMFIYSISTLFWSFRLKRYLQNEEYVWSTNPNVLNVLKKCFDNVIYEKHGAARFIQKYSINQLKKANNTTLIGVTRKSVEELYNNIKEPLYLPNGVDGDFFFPNSEQNEEITIGYIGLLETYGIDKGVLSSVEEIIKVNEELKTKTLIVGGPKNKLDEIQKVVNTNKQSSYFDIKNFIPHNEVPNVIRQMQIGIVPYPNESHMKFYASPLKVFEFAACGVPVLLSDIDSHLELKSLNLGIYYFKNNDFDDFRQKLIELIKDSDLRNSLRKKSLDNINNLFWDKRIKKIVDSVRSSTG